MPAQINNKYVSITIEYGHLTIKTVEFSGYDFPLLYTHLYNYPFRQSPILHSEQGLPQLPIRISSNFL